MKFTAFFLLVACLQVSAHGIAQGISLSEKNAPLSAVFQKIEKQTGYTFWYENVLLKNTHRVDLEVRNASLEQVLDKCFEKQPLTYTIIDKIIVVKEKKNQIVTIQPGDIPEPPLIDVRGRVLTDKGEPVKGVTVTVRGTGKATSTDNNGTFTLNNVDPDAVLIFTSVNTETFELSVRGRAELLVNLKNKVTALDDVKIIAYGTTSERLRTGAVSSVKAETIEKQPVGNVLLALQGQVPGLHITQSTALPGARVEFNLRGLNSLGPLGNFQGSNEPLVVIDGVPFSNNPITFGGISVSNNAYNGVFSPLAAINPSDIERIDVLKDADATAIYGSRGANGVLLITTKRAVQGKPSLTVDFSKGFGKLSRRLDLLTTRQYLDMRYEAFANDGVNWQTPTTFAPDLKIWDTTRYTDWQEELVGGTANFTKANVSYSGGTAQTSFHLSTNYRREGSIFGDRFKGEIFSATMSLHHQSPNNRLSLDVSANSTYNDILQPNANTYQVALSLPPNAPKLYNEDGSLNWENATFANPMADLLHTNEIKSNNINTSLTFSYRAAKNLTLKVTAAYGKSDWNADNIEPIASLSPFSSTPVTGWGRYNRTLSFNTSLEPQAEYNAKLGPGKLNALLGFALQRRGSEKHSMYGSGFTSDDLIRNYGSAPILAVDPVAAADYRYNAAFARLGYNIHNQYIFSLNARRDGSSRFGPGKQFGNFGSASMAWIFSEHAAIKKAIPFISYGKLRLSYGITGSDEIGDYNYLSLYTNTPNVATFNPPFSRQLPARLFNPDYHWEVNRKADVELSLGFLNNRILATANYYNNRSSNQLIGIPLPDMTGFTAVSGNLNATVQNTGWEFQLNTENVKSKNFSWNSNFNFTIPRNKLIEYPNLATSPHRSFFVVGQPIRIRKVYDHVGVDPQTGLHILRTAGGKDTVLLTGSLTSSDQISIDMTPKFYGGWTNNFGYKRWNLSFMMQYNYSMRENDISVLPTMPGFQGNITQYVYNNSWRKPGDQALFQKFTQRTSSPAYFSRTSLTDAYYSNIWFVRLNNLSLSYDLSTALIKRLHLSSCQLYVQGQNLFTLTNFEGTDPEGGVNTMPHMRVLIAGVKLKF